MRGGEAYVNSNDPLPRDPMRPLEIPTVLSSALNMPLVRRIYASKTDITLLRAIRSVW